MSPHFKRAFKRLETVINIVFWCLPLALALLFHPPQVNAQGLNPSSDFVFSTVVREENPDRWSTYGGTWHVRGNRLVAHAQGPAKSVLRDVNVKNFELQVSIRAEANTQAGLFFRASDIDESIDGYRGYYIGMHAEKNEFIWGAADHNWTSIATRSAAVPADRWFHFRVRVIDHHFQAWINDHPIVETDFPKFDGIDNRYTSGSIGLRVLGKRAEFKDLVLSQPTPDVPSSAYTNPVQGGCADPALLLHEGTYYAYCTYSRDHPLMARGIRLYTSTDLTQWTDRGFVIKQSESWGKSRFWAPDIIEKAGVFYLYYSADTRVCVARSTNPSGPFKQIGHLPMEPESIRIDAHVFRDDDGKMYFYYVTFDGGNEIWGAELSEDMVTLRPETRTRMIHADAPWERHRGNIVEGPVILKHGGTYYLTYSGSHFESPHYAVGYATSESPLGPWTKHEHNPVMKSTSYAHGAAHHDFARSPDGREFFIVYHRHYSLEATEPRAMAIDRVRFVRQDEGPEILEIHGPTATPQPRPSGSPP
ncbi:MAG: family 43 glycosylhydrolase [Planctomycetota bacterium]|nr:family 43 glycosylhydrolase [Planctomycetota bacterium]